MGSSMLQRSQHRVSMSLASTFANSSDKPTTTAAVEVYNSPSKRRRLSPATDCIEVQSSSSQEFWKWTLTKDAVAPCRVRDVFAMKENRSKG